MALDYNSVNNAFKTVYARAATAAEAAVYGSYPSTEAVTQVLYETDAYREQTLPVARLYAAVLGRDPEPAGLAYYIQHMRDEGLTLPQAAFGFLHSPEAQTKFGYATATDLEFIQQLYRVCLGRDGEQAGIDYYLKELGDGVRDRASVAISFSYSPENQERVGEKHYAAFDATAATRNGSVIDGYVAGATVFADANGDGVWNEGEALTTTDAAGKWALTDAQGTLIVTGGTDISTQLPHTGVLMAPAGATVVNPLTSLQAALVASGQTPAQAQASVAQAFGLEASVDLANYDPLAVAFSATASAAEKAQAVSVQAAAAKLQNLLVTASNALVGVAGATALNTMQASEAVISAIATALSNDSDGVVSLGDPAFLATVLTTSVTASGSAELIAKASAVADMSTSFASVAAAAAQKLDAALAAGGNVTATLAKIAQVQTAVQGTVAEQIRTAAGADNFASVVGDLTGSALDSLVAGAEAGDLDPHSDEDDAVVEDVNAGGSGTPAPSNGGGGGGGDPAPFLTVGFDTDGNLVFGGNVSGTVSMAAGSNGALVFTRGGVTASVTLPEQHVLQLTGGSANVTGGKLHDSIVAALEAGEGAPSSIVIVGAGTYEEAVTLDRDGVRLVTNAGASIEGPVRVEASNVLLSGFVLDGEGQEGSNDRGLQIVTGEYITISHMTVRNFLTGASLDFATSSKPKNVTFTDNVFSNNTAGIGSTEDIKGLVIRNNTFQMPDDGEGIGLGGHAELSTGSGPNPNLLPGFDVKWLLENNTFSGDGKSVAEYRGSAGTAATFVVDGDNLQDAIDATEPGSTILVHAGTYGPIDINKPGLKVIAMGPGARIEGVHEGGEGGVGAGSTVMISADWVVLGGFEIDNDVANNADGRAVAPMNSEGALIAHNTFVDAFRGIQGDFYGAPQQLVIIGNTFTDSVQYGIAGTEGMSIAWLGQNTFSTSEEAIGIGEGATFQGQPISGNEIFTILDNNTFALPDTARAIVDYQSGPHPVWVHDSGTFFNVYDDLTSTAVNESQMWAGTDNPATGFNLSINPQENLQLALDVRRHGDPTPVNPGLNGEFQVGGPAGDIRFAYSVSAFRSELNLDAYDVILRIDTNPDEGTTFTTLKLARGDLGGDPSTNVANSPFEWHSGDTYSSGTVVIHDDGGTQWATQNIQAIHWYQDETTLAEGRYNVVLEARDKEDATLLAYTAVVIVVGTVE